MGQWGAHYCVMTHERVWHFVTFGVALRHDVGAAYSCTPPSPRLARIELHEIMNPAGEMLLIRYAVF